jgi:hypothetical protein
MAGKKGKKQCVARLGKICLNKTQAKKHLIQVIAKAEKEPLGGGGIVFYKTEIKQMKRIIKAL